MTFGREKRSMLAWLALLAPLPLPFSQVLEWPVLFLYTLFLVYFLQRLERDRPTVLPNWLLNLLGLAYLPLLAVDLKASVARSRPVTALLHLIMFLILVKLYSMRREKDKWHLLIASFFLFVGGMATSTHVTVGLYLLAFMLFALLVLARFAHLHMLSAAQRSPGQRGDPRPPRPPRPPQPVPYRAPLAAGTALAVVIAVPIFAALPRLREPFILGPASGTGGLIRTTGFSDSVDLSLTTAIRGNREVVLRLKYADGARRTGEGIRIKGATYDRYENRRWHRMLQHSTVLSPEMGEDGRTFRLDLDGEAAGEPAGKVEIFRERLNSTSLFLPVEATVLAIEMPSIWIDLGGAVYLPGLFSDPIRYEAQLAAEPRIPARLARLGAGEVSPLTALDQSGVTDRMRQLARAVMGEGPAGERIDRLERHLLSEYSYTLDFVGRDGEHPLEDFLFRYRSGHCEYFASSMVLLLRAENIPARLATGFLGAEYNPLEGYFIVRQDNAHAWVEAYAESRGWRLYDPTPPEGRPVIPESSFLRFMGQLYDYLTFRWDRYVLTYGAEDQRDFFERARERFAALWHKLTGWASRTDDEALTQSVEGLEAANDIVIREPRLWLSRVPVAIALTLFLATLAGLVAWQRRQPLTGAAAYWQLRRCLERAGLAVSDSLAPLRLRDLAVARYPSATAPTRRLVELYLRESFAEKPLDAGERASLKDHLHAVREAVKRDDRERKRARRLTPRRG